VEESTELAYVLYNIVHDHYRVTKWKGSSWKLWHTAKILWRYWYREI